MRPAPDMTAESVAEALHQMVAERRAIFSGPRQEIGEDGRFRIHCSRCPVVEAGDSIGDVVQQMAKHVVSNHNPLEK